MTGDEITAERQLWLRWIADAWHAGMAHGEAIHATDFDRGYNTAIAELKTTDRDLVRALTTSPTLWTVRGQRRTRATYALPHPDDYTGGPVKWTPP